MFAQVLFALSVPCALPFDIANARATDGDDERTDARLFPPTRADEEGTKTRTRGDEATRGTNEAKENDDEGRRKANERGKTRGRGAATKRGLAGVSRHSIPRPDSCMISARRRLICFRR